MLVFTAEKLAACFDLTPKRIKQLRAAGVLKEVEPGKELYEPVENIRSYIAYIKRGAGGDYYEERAKLVSAKRRKEELELDELDGELHRAVDVERIVSQMLVKFRSKILSLPTKLTPSMAETSDKGKINGILTEAVNEALEELSDYDKLFREGGREKAEKHGETV